MLQLPDVSLDQASVSKIANTLCTGHDDLSRAEAERYVPDIKRALSLYAAMSAFRASAPAPSEIRDELDVVADAARNLHDALTGLSDGTFHVLSNRLILAEAPGRKMTECPVVSAMIQYLRMYERAAETFEPTKTRDVPGWVLSRLLVRTWIDARKEIPGATHGGPFWRFMHACMATLEDDPTPPIKKIREAVRYHRENE